VLNRFVLASVVDCLGEEVDWLKRVKRICEALFALADGDNYWSSGINGHDGRA
jgi:hypothetical protein